MFLLFNHDNRISNFGSTFFAQFIMRLFESSQGSEIGNIFVPVGSF